jgi:hypothetical protein
MLNVKQAIDIIKKHIPNGRIISNIEYKNLYVFKVFTSDDLEGEFDPFYSVDKVTGKFSDFSIITDGNISELINLFVKAESK